MIFSLFLISLHICMTAGEAQTVTWIFSCTVSSKGGKTLQISSKGDLHYNGPDGEECILKIESKSYNANKFYPVWDLTWGHPKCKKGRGPDIVGISLGHPRNQVKANDLKSAKAYFDPVPLEYLACTVTGHDRDALHVLF